MRNLRETFLRLMILAQHLETGEMKESYEKLHFFYSDDRKFLLIGRGGKYHMVIPQVVFELPYLFSHFKRTASGQVYYDLAPEVQVNYAVMEFFGLELKEYLHLFCVDRASCDLYGGKPLTLDYTVNDIANNIFIFLEKVLEAERKRNQE